MKVSTLINSFKATGLCPLNRSAIRDELLAQAAVYGKLEAVIDKGNNKVAEVNEESGRKDSDTAEAERSRG